MLGVPAQPGLESFPSVDSTLTVNIFLLCGKLSHFSRFTSLPHTCPRELEGLEILVSYLSEIDPDLALLEAQKLETIQIESRGLCACQQYLFLVDLERVY